MDEMLLGGESECPQSSHVNKSEGEEEEGILDDGFRFLKLAEKGGLEEMDKLLSRDSSLLSFQDSDGYTALHRAAYSEQRNVIDFLLSRGADICMRTIDGWTALHSACRWNSYNSVTSLLQKGADINAKTDGGLTPLHIAAESAIARETLIVLLLNEDLEKDVQNMSGETAETIAGQHGSYSYLFELVRKSLVCF